MFAKIRYPKLTETDAADFAKLYPGKLVIARNFIKVYLADVDVMTTTYVKTTGMPKAIAYQLVKNDIATARHYQIHV